MQLPATLTLAQASAALRALGADIERGRPGSPLSLDAAPLAAFDTSAIAVLLELQRLARARGVALKVCNPPPKLAQLATLYGVDGLLDLG